VVTTQTLERTDGLNTLNAALQAIKASIEEAGGMFNIQLQVKYLKYYLKIIIKKYCEKKRKKKYIMSLIGTVIEIKEIVVKKIVIKIE
jgi:hypothetical protein